MALGHPLGGTGTKLIATLLTELELRSSPGSAGAASVAQSLSWAAELVSPPPPLGSSIRASCSRQIEVQLPLAISAVVTATENPAAANDAETSSALATASDAPQIERILARLEADKALCEKSSNVKLLAGVLGEPDTGVKRGSGG